MRLIDADVLFDDVIKRYCKDCYRRKGIKRGKWRIIYEIGEAPCRACSVDDMMSEVEEAPTIEAEPIVRCKDCKWYEWGLTECHNPRYGDGWANYPSPQVYDEYFCKDGEREVNDD